MNIIVNSFSLRKFGFIVLNTGILLNFQYHILALLFIADNL